MLNFKSNITKNTDLSEKKKKDKNLCSDDKSNKSSKLVDIIPTEIEKVKLRKTFSIYPPLLKSRGRTSIKGEQKQKNTKKEENQILTLLTENMEDQTKNLENPKDFYSNYFQSMLKIPNTLNKKQKIKEKIRNTFNK